MVCTWASPSLHAVKEATLPNTVCEVMPVSLPEGELGCGGISTYWEEETRRKAGELVAAVEHLPRLPVRVPGWVPGWQHGTAERQQVKWGQW